MKLPVNRHRRLSLAILLLTAFALYVLADILLNPFILWTSLPLYLSYYFIDRAVSSGSIKRLYAAYGFMLAAIAFSVFYHITWYTDWQGTRTGSSTSALIFVWMPVYSVIIGFVGYFLASLPGALIERRQG